MYTSLLKSTQHLKCGIMVLPNVDGNHFKSEVAHVELDVVVVHPRKGVFVFNVKNARKLKIANIREDMKKHSAFIHLIQSHPGSTVGGVTGQQFTVPVHCVLCTLQEPLDVSFLQPLIDHSKVNPRHLFPD